MKPTHTAGDTFREVVDLPAYPFADGWVLKLRLIARSGNQAPIEITGTGAADGRQHLVQALASATADWPAGEYGWVTWVERSGDSFTTGSGQITIQPDPRQVTGALDTRTLAERTLADLEAAYASFVSTRGAIKRYRIMERETEFQSAAEIQRQIKFWSDKVKAEKEAARIAAGGAPRNRIKLRFTRPR